MSPSDSIHRLDVEAALRSLDSSPRGLSDNAAQIRAREFGPNALTSNVPELVPYLAFVLLRIPLPVTIIQVLAVDLGTDMLPALGLGAEPPDPQVMSRAPRSRHDRLIDCGLLRRAYFMLGPIEAVAAMAAYGLIITEGILDGLLKRLDSGVRRHRR